MHYKILLYKHKTYSDGTHPIMLQMMINGTANRIGLGFRGTPEQWDASKGRFSRSRRNYQRLNYKLNELEQQADDIRVEMLAEDIPLTFEAFKARWEAEKKGERGNVFTVFQEIIDDLIKKDRLGNARVYQEAYDILRKYHKSQILSFATLNATFLEALDNHLRAGGRTDGGISIVMRTIRAAFNAAIKKGLVSAKYYPFDSRQYKGYKIRNLKSMYRPKYLTAEDMNKIKGFPANEYPDLKESWLMFLFSYYGRGINFADMARMRWSNIYGDRVTYIRQKTKSRRKETTPCGFPVNDNINNLLDYFRGRGEYVFPILNDFHQTEQQKQDRIKKRRRKYNADLKAISEILGIEIPLTSYTARHSYAMALRNNGIAIDKISQLMNHAGVEVTKAYLDKFPNEELDETDELL